MVMVVMVFQLLFQVHRLLMQAVAVVHQMVMAVVQVVRAAERLVMEAQRQHQPHRTQAAVQVQAQQRLVPLAVQELLSFVMWSKEIV
jgi:hypothetical protein